MELSILEGKSRACFLTQEMEQVLDMVNTVAAEHRGGLELCVCITPRDASAVFLP